MRILFCYSILSLCLYSADLNTPQTLDRHIPNMTIQSNGTVNLTGDLTQMTGVLIVNNGNVSMKSPYNVTGELRPLAYKSTTPYVIIDQDHPLIIETPADFAMIQNRTLYFKGAGLLAFLCPCKFDNDILLDPNARPFILSFATVFLNGSIYSKAPKGTTNQQPIHLVGIDARIHLGNLTYSPAYIVTKAMIRIINNILFCNWHRVTSHENSVERMMPYIKPEIIKMSIVAKAENTITYTLSNQHMHGPVIRKHAGDLKVFTPCILQVSEIHPDCAQMKSQQELQKTLEKFNPNLHFKAYDFNEMPVWIGLSNKRVHDLIETQSNQPLFVEAPLQNTLRFNGVYEYSQKSPVVEPIIAQSQQLPENPGEEITVTITAAQELEKDTVVSEPSCSKESLSDMPQTLVEYIQELSELQATAPVETSEQEATLSEEDEWWMIDLSALGCGLSW